MTVFVAGSGRTIKARARLTRSAPRRPERRRVLRWSFTEKTFSAMARIKYYLARNLCGSIQYSDEFFTSYKRAEEIRQRQVNPQQWIVVCNPIFGGNTAKFNVGKTALRKYSLLKTAIENLQDLLYM